MFEFDLDVFRQRITGKISERACGLCAEPPPGSYPQGVLAIYQRSSRWPELLLAMELWGRLLANAIAGKKSHDKVVAIVRAG